MPYLIVDDFRVGLDLRKGPVTSPAQSLRVLKNAIVTAGGEIEKRKAFVKHTSAPGTVGLYGANNEFVVFKLGTTPGTRTPITPIVNAFQLTNTTPIESLVSAQFWQDTYFVEMYSAAGGYKAYHDGVLLAPTLSQGIDACVFETKMYVPSGSVLKWSAVNDPANWDTTVVPANGSGFVDVSTADAFGSTILGVERYFQSLAVFGKSTIQIWTMDPDPKLNAISQTIGSTGLFGRGAKTTFANGDVIYLAQTGIRSLKARDSSNFAITTDVGSPIDEYMKTIVAGMTQAQIDRIQCVVEPRTGAFWISLGTKILILSFYPSSTISAWSEFDVPFNIDYMAVNDQYLAIRSGDDIYFYGGDTLTPAYDNTEAVIQTPFLDAKDPAAKKMFRSIDAAVQGTWAVRYNVNPRVPDAWSSTAILMDETYTIDTVAMQAQSTHIAFELRCSDAAPSRLSSLVCHFEGKQAT